MTVLFNQLHSPAAAVFSASLWDADGLSVAEKNEAYYLLGRLGRIHPRNHTRTLWYEAKNVVQHLGIAVPEALESIAPVLGWPSRAVDDLAERIILDGFVAPGNGWEQSGLADVWAENKLPLLSSQTHTSTLKYSVSFVAAIRGGEGEPAVILRTFSATTSTGRWSDLHSRLTSFITLTSKDLVGRVSGFLMITDEASLVCKMVDGVWTVDRRPHKVGRPPVSAIIHNPSVENPFGTSRITRPVMSIGQRAIRSLLRMEVSAEFYSSPQRAVLGADEADFVDSAGNLKTGWEVTIGKLLALSRDEDGGLPQVHQFAQASMEPHIAMVRSDAALFSGETGIPVDTLGIIHDNPSSAEGVDARYKKLNSAATNAHLSFGSGWADVMRLAVIVREDDPRAADSLKGLEANMRPPHLSSIGEASDAIVKQVGAIPWLAETTVVLRRLQYSKAEIEEMQAEKQRSEASSRIAQLVQAAKGLRTDDSGDGVSNSDTVPGQADAGATA